MNAYGCGYRIVLCKRHDCLRLRLAYSAGAFVSVCRRVINVIVHLLPAGIEILIQINTVGIGLKFGLIVFKRPIYFPVLFIEFITHINDCPGCLRSKTVHTELGDRDTVRVSHGNDVKTYI